MKLTRIHVAAAARGFTKISGPDREGRKIIKIKVILN